MDNNPNPEIPEIQVGEIDFGIIELFDNSAKWMQWGLEALAFLLIAYTLPHNAHAFGLERIIDFRTLGLLVIELTFGLSVLHFTRGWLADDGHRTAAYSTIALSAIILIFNSALSQLLYLLADPDFVRTVQLEMIVDGYRMFILPATPILAVLLATWLVSAHPAVRGVGEMFSHIAKMADMTRKSEIKKKEATHIQIAAVTDKEAAKGLLATERVKNETLRYQAEASFTHRTQKAMLRARDNQRTEIMESREWVELVNLAEKQSLIDELDKMYPNLSIRNFIGSDGGMINPAELIEQIEDLLNQVNIEAEAAAGWEQEAKKTSEANKSLREEITRLTEELTNRPQQPAAYANGHAAD